MLPVLNLPANTRMNKLRKHPACFGQVAPSNNKVPTLITNTQNRSFQIQILRGKGRNRGQRKVSRTTFPNSMRNEFVPRFFFLFFFFTLPNLFAQVTAVLYQIWLLPLHFLDAGLGLETTVLQPCLQQPCSAGVLQYLARLSFLAPLTRS